MTHGSNDPGPGGLAIEVAAAGKASVVALAGEIDAASVPQLRQCVEQLAAGGQVDQVLDLSRVEFLDSSGLGALVSLRRRLEEHGGALVLACENEIVLRLLRLTSLDTVLTIYPTVAEAIGSSADHG